MLQLFDSCRLLMKVFIFASGILLAIIRNDAHALDFDPSDMGFGAAIGVVYNGNGAKSQSDWQVVNGKIVTKEKAQVSSPVLMEAHCFDCSFFGNDSNLRSRRVSPFLAVGLGGDNNKILNGVGYGILFGFKNQNAIAKSNLKDKVSKTERELIDVKGGAKTKLQGHLSSEFGILATDSNAPDSAKQTAQKTVDDQVSQDSMVQQKTQDLSAAKSALESEKAKTRTAFNVGIGVYHQFGIKALADGFSTGDTLPASVQEIPTKSVTRTSAMLIFSFSWE